MARPTVGQVVVGLSAAASLPFAALAVALAPSAPLVDASSHREAPMIAQDPPADGTDFYMFPSPENNGTITFVANYWPLEEPYAGPNFFRFDEDVKYSIHLDNNGDNTPDITYDLRFRTEIRNKNTFLYNTGPVTSIDDPDLNVRQFYTVTRTDGAGARELGANIPVPPVHIGPKSMPEGYAKIAAEGIRDLGEGVGQVYAGQRADPFFVDLGAAFDLLNVRKLPGTNNEAGVNSLNGKNVQSIVLQVPITKLTADGQPVSGLDDPQAVLGAWTTSSRMKTRVLNGDGTMSNSGEWVQVSRLGNPLVNELVIPLGIKDAFNSLKPENDVAAGALPLVQDPEPARILKSLFNVNVPPAPRDDLVAIFLTGIPGSVLGLPGATAPMNVPEGASTASEMLRLNMATPPTAIGEGERLAALAGDIRGFPNGRRLTDDVVDIALQAVAGVTYKLTHPEFTPDPIASQLGDGVSEPDPSAPLLSAFPYVGIPHRGYDVSNVAAGNFGFVRCTNGQVFRLNPDFSIGQFVSDPATIGNEPIFQASGSVTAAEINAICGPTRSS